MPRLPRLILGAHHVYPGVNSRDAYLCWHAAEIRKLQAAFPRLLWGDPHPHEGLAPPLYVAGGVARIECPECAAHGCENCPAVWIEQRVGLACCIECGAIYEGIAVPDRWAEIEAALVLRLRGPERYWNPTLTVEDLRAQNASGQMPLQVED